MFVTQYTPGRRSRLRQAAGPGNALAVLSAAFRSAERGQPTLPAKVFTANSAAEG
jgi:hypothetical protein